LKFNVVNIINSFIGKKGNIGLRTSYIINELNIQKIKNFSYSRGVVQGFEKNNKNMGVFGQIPRILNAIRIYINENYNHRKHDVWLFDKWFNLVFRDTKISNSKIAHIWEHSPKIIQKMKDLGYVTILDVPIGPNSTSKELMNKFSDIITLHPHEYNLELEKKSYKLVDYIIAPSVFVRDELLKLSVDEDKIFLVPFGAKYDEVNKEFVKDYSNDGIDYCFAGAINKRKGVEFLLDAWDDERFKNDRLHLCGRLFSDIEKIIKEKNFTNVITPGFINTEEYFKKCDVYVFPSLLEGSSKSIYEAMNRSLPCITTHNSGSVIEDGYDGFIVDIASSKQIKDKMLYFKENIKDIENMGNYAKEKIKKYSWDNYAKNVIDIYKKVVK